jgi:hypothetical protein
MSGNSLLWHSNRNQKLLQGKKFPTQICKGFMPPVHEHSLAPV